MIDCYDFIPPRILRRMCAEHMKEELILDNLGACRFHRRWAVEMLLDIIGELYGCKDQFLQGISVLSSRINSRNSPIFWESERNSAFLQTFLKRKHEVDQEPDPRQGEWLARFEQDKIEAAKEFW